MKIWTCGSSPRSGSRNALTRIKNVNGAIRLSKFWNFFGAIQMSSCRDWLPWTIPGYITMTRSQINNQWSGGIAAHPASKEFRVQKSAGKFLASIFLGSKRHLPHWLSSKRPNYQRGVLLISAGAIEGHLGGKHFSGSSPKWSCSCTTKPRLTKHLQPRRNWPIWASNVLITHPILRIWSYRTTTCSMDWKKNERSQFLFRRGGHCCRGDLVGRTKFWIFWVACKS